VRIVHISDLHFGSHNESLEQNLRETQIAALRPDLIIATGDLVNTPNDEDFTKVFQFLDSLAAACTAPDSSGSTATSESKSPRVVVVPGNHDYGEDGVVKLWNKRLYARHSRGRTTSHYFQPENVWVYGFDSAKRGSFSSGKIQDVELQQFHAEYTQHEQKYGEAFARAFKIVAVHHHPLPVNWDTDWRQRWLTMSNSGTLLGALLHRKIDLVLHGHEHLQARARLQSTLGGDGDWHIAVVSVGTTLKRINSPEQNVFNLITIDETGAVELTPYEADQYAFYPGTNRTMLRTSGEARLRSFQAWVNREGFVYDEVASVTALNSDGDCRRIVECDDLQIVRAESPRSTEHDLRLPPTSGYIDLLDVTVPTDGRHAGMYLEPTKNENVVKIKYGQNVTLATGETISYQYHWWAINAFAMDARQFQGRYADKSRLEFTHFPVTDPIRDLTVIVQFPESFTPASTPQIRVTIANAEVKDNREWKRAMTVEQGLNDKKALRYVGSLRTAALRVSMPLEGYCYGIEWRVPDSPLKKVAFDPDVTDVVEKAIRVREDARLRNVFDAILVGTIDPARQLILGNWQGPLVLSLMVYDAPKRKLVILSALEVRPDGKIYELDRSIEFGYGEGIGGRAFKTNESRLHVHREVERRTDPNYYRHVVDRTPDSALLSIPIQNPGMREQVYGVINIASQAADCPLRQVADADSTWKSSAATLQEVANKSILTALRLVRDTGLHKK
jgi:3',5'-cyclic AMP phosphodiesterase CpdA